MADEAAAVQVEQGGTEAAGETAQDGQITEGEQAEGGGGRSSNSFSKYVSLGGGGEDASFKWNFVTNKLADLKTKGMMKTN